MNNLSYNKKNNFKNCQQKRSYCQIKNERERERERQAKKRNRLIGIQSDKQTDIFAIRKTIDGQAKSKKKVCNIRKRTFFNTKKVK